MKGFKIGDRVVRNQEQHDGLCGSAYLPPNGSVGKIIIANDDDAHYCVSWDNAIIYGSTEWWYDEAYIDYALSKGEF